MNKIKFSIIILLPFFLLSCKTSQKQAKNIDKELKLENALLWKIEGNGLTEPSYLFGTIHLIKSDKFFLPKGFQNAFNKSEYVIFEIDVDKMNDISEQMKLLPKILMKGDTSLKDLITADQYKQVKDYFSEKHLPLFLFEKVKPMFLTMFTDGDFDPLSMKNGEYLSYELEISKMVKEKHKKTGGLETIEFQVGVLDSIPYKYQAEMLMKSINSDRDSSAMDNMYNLYLSQNISALHQSIESDDLSKYEKILLNNRNNTWIPRMAEYMRKDPSLFAVGAGHLGGKQGVINLLRKAGYKLIPVLH